ncbi:MAG TPA: protein kinase [Thermoanaerobaculia bacterium]|nr:protein kinase [Thermoanaerobaculia bacterium]
MLSPGVRLGPYEILAPLGAGGMGEVFRARDTRLGRQVAVKILPDAVSQDPARVSRFETEARALATLSHPNILSIHDFGRSDGRLFTVTELLEGETLRDRMGGEPVVWRKAAEIAASIADGLASAHAAGIVHRDLKPENVFLTSDGRTKVLDFGLARVASPVSDSADTLTSPSPVRASVDGEIVGTLSYMAPEQLRSLKVDGRADIFALGCVLYEMLAGDRPFAGATHADTISAILHAEPPPLDAAGGAGIPPALALIVSRCLEKRPEDRFDTAHDLALSLRGLSTAPVLPAPRAPTAKPALAGRGTRIAATVLLVALALVGAAILTSRTNGRRSAPAAWNPPRQITSSPGWDGEPALSPDGTLVAYSSNASGRCEIWVVDTEGGEPLRLTDGGGENRNPVWFPDGRTVAFVATQGASTSVRKVSRLGGSTTLLVENADTPAISPDGASIAFSRADEGGTYRVWVSPIADPSKAVRRTGDEDGVADHLNPAWSPDGTRICYAAFRDLWVVPAAGGKPSQLTHEETYGREPAFSPDGAWVYFNSRISLPPSIWRVAATGGSLERVMSGTGSAVHPSFSRDGDRLVFASYTRDVDILLLDRMSGFMSRIATSADDETPALAPDGSAVAFMSNRSGAPDLWIQEIRNGRIENSSARRLASLPKGIAAPAFAPDGRFVAFFTVTEGHRAIWAVPLDGGAAFPLVQAPSDNMHPAYAPDMSRLAFVSNQSGRFSIWVVALKNGRPDGDPWPATAGAPGEELFPAWAPDGRRIAFLRGSDVWVTDVRPGAEAHAVISGEGVQAIAFEPDGTTLLAPGLFGTPSLHLRRVHLDTGRSEPVEPRLALGDRNALGSVSVSRDGRLVATDLTNLKGNLWFTTATRDGR